MPRGGGNTVYRALTAADAEAIAAGRGLTAKAPNGTWTAAEHVANSGPGVGGAAANSPWISASRILEVARAYHSGHGVVAIDVSRVPGLCLATRALGQWSCGAAVPQVDLGPRGDNISERSSRSDQGIGAMRTIDEIESDLKRGITEAVVPLQTTREVDAAGLERLVAWAHEGATVLKGQQQLPRSFLNELYAVSHVIRAEGQHHRDARVRELADRLEMAFALILRGEAPGDRRPGVPRIV